VSREKYFHKFRPFEEDPDPEWPSLTFEIHPYANPMVESSLTFAQRESIYFQAQNHTACYEAIGLFQMFFVIIPEEQEISIQYTNEVYHVVRPF
jgi:hypothetical protein